MKHFPTLEPSAEIPPTDGGNAVPPPPPNSAAAPGLGGAPTDSPVHWFASRYPKIATKFGDALLTGFTKGIERVNDLNEDFFAALMGEAGTPSAPMIFLQDENRFFGYCADKEHRDFGIFIEVSTESIIARLSALLLSCARDCRTAIDTSALEFGLRQVSKLRGVVAKAKALLAVRTDYFMSGTAGLVACANGVLFMEGRLLFQFEPCFRLRHKLTVSFLPEATCPLFLNTLMRPALSAEDLDFVQRWCGLAILGKNLAQVILVLVGTAGGGKGTFVLVVKGILGPNNVGTLRPKLLEDRFEVGRLLGRCLLYGADVAANFLNYPGASVLKSLVGGDPVTVEFKNSNQRPELNCWFNCLLTCNSRLTVRLEGDVEAWRRRLRLITYSRPPTQSPIADLAARILKEEGAGVLNWMLDGLDRLRADAWQLRGNAEQTARVDDLLAESDSVVMFVREALQTEAGATMTLGEAFAHYINFCGKRGWGAVDRKRFSETATAAVSKHLHIVLRHDVPDHDGSEQRGWKGVGACT